jgi:exonuclease I
MYNFTSPRKDMTINYIHLIEVFSILIVKYFMPHNHIALATGITPKSITLHTGSL